MLFIQNKPLSLHQQINIKIMKVMIEITITIDQLRDLILRNENPSVINLAHDLMEHKHTTESFSSTCEFINQASEEDLLHLFNEL